jgi:hypothetical protein
LTRKLRDAATRTFDPSNKEAAEEFRDIVRDVDEMVREARVDIAALKSTFDTTPEWRGRRWVPLMISYLDTQLSRIEELESAQKELLARLESRPPK